MIIETPGVMSDGSDAIYGSWPLGSRGNRTQTAGVFMREAAARGLLVVGTLLS
jgi:hypothetical protein